MRAIVDKSGCIGCSMCASTCPEVFHMENGVAEGGLVPPQCEAEARQAASECPVSVIDTL